MFNTTNTPILRKLTYNYTVYVERNWIRVFNNLDLTAQPCLQIETNYAEGDLVQKVHHKLLDLSLTEDANVEYDKEADKRFHIWAKFNNGDLFENPLTVLESLKAQTHEAIVVTETEVFHVLYQYGVQTSPTTAEDVVVLISKGPKSLLDARLESYAKYSNGSKPYPFSEPSSTNGRLQVLMESTLGTPIKDIYELRGGNRLNLAECLQVGYV